MGPKAQTACLGNEKGRRVETGLHPGAGRLPHSLGRAIKTSRKAPLALLGASAFEELVARMRCSSDEAARGRDGMTVHPSAPEDVAPAAERLYAPAPRASLSFTECHFWQV